MKKTFLTIAILSSIAFFACTKKEVAKIEKNDSQKSLISREIQYLFNYCSECGGSNNKDYGCKYVQYADGHNTYLCEGLGVCGIIHMNDLIDDSSTNLTHIDNNAAYRARDSFFIMSEKTQDYITYYNLISAVVIQKNTINLSNIMSHYNLLNSFITASNNVIDGNNSDIIINSTFKQNAQSMINYYRNVDTSQYFQNILNVLETDLAFFENKTRAQVLNNLNINNVP